MNTQTLNLSIKFVDICRAEDLLPSAKAKLLLQACRDAGLTFSKIGGGISGWRLIPIDLEDAQHE